jgi:hypothetical protein
MAVFILGLCLGQLGWSDRLSQSAAETLAKIKLSASDNPLPSITIDMAFVDYNTILDQRAEALEMGVFLGGEEEFVPATMHLQDGASEVLLPVRMRLIQGPARSLGDNEKWGFEVRTLDGSTLMGMSRFSLQDPASNNWLYQWAFLQTLRQEGVLTTDYRFVDLVFNGDERGIYALQEGFGDELLLSQDQPAGVIVEFAPERLWESIRHYQGDAEAALADPLANLSSSGYQFLEVDTFRDATISEDELLTAQKNTAIGLLRGLQSGELTAAQLFDVEKYGTFLALVDLWGAMDALSLTNLRFYYDEENGRLQPIAYNANPLSTDKRIDLASTYGDPAIQAAYARAAQRISQPKYLEELRLAMEPELDLLRQAVDAEISQESPWELLEERQAQMRQSLQPVQPVFSYLGSPSQTMSATIQIDVANILNLPVVIEGFDIGQATFLEARPDMIQGNAGDLLVSTDDGSIVLRAVDGDQPAAQYVRFQLSTIEIQERDNELDFMQEPQISVATRILGQELVQLTPARAGYPERLLPQ